MKKPFLALLLLVGAAAMAATTAFAQTEDLVPSKLPTTTMMKDVLSARAQKLRTSAAQNDTVWFGHSYANHFNSASNWWNLYTGVNFGGITGPTTARWDFDNYTGIGNGVLGSEGVDSLQGWWSTRARYTAALATMSDDKVRTWGALDAGNEVNQIQPGRKRTKGVVGVWHADPGNGSTVDNTNPGNPYIWWAPLSGSKSAWCGLRGLHDLTVSDPITHNPFNQEAMELFGRNRATIAYGTLRNFPGYSSQWDQMLYRDLSPADNTPFTIKFLYKTRMSSTADVSTTGKCGYFWGDPLKTATLNDGNFISALDAGAANSPVDSFMVYVGVPVDESNIIYSNGSVASSLSDPQRRWFSEVLALYPDILNGYPQPPLFELTSTTGAVPADTTLGPTTITRTVSGAQVHAIYSYPSNTGHKMRLVFRVKTNRSFDDTDFNANKIGGGIVAGNGFSSLGRGAALLDDVQIDAAGGSSFTTIGDFEGANGGIDNTTSTPATSAWKSTGKPGGNYFHPADVQTVPWDELCGRPNSGTSRCDMAGVVADGGNVMDGEAMGDSRYQSMIEVEWGIMSPTIDLTTSNTMGLTPAMVDPSDDYYIAFDIYTAATLLSLGTGCGYIPCSQWYPVRQINGNDVWSDRIQPPFNIYNDAKQCYNENDTPFLLYNCKKTTASSGVPDSMRVYVGLLQQCFVYGASVTCNSRDGAYYDNVALAFVNTSATAVEVNGSLSADIWQFFTDAFPVNGTTGNANTPGSGTAFDTTTALITGTINTAPTTGNKTRFDVMADSIVVQANDGTHATPSDTNSIHMRVDMIFRILPGPGNYNDVGRVFPPVSSMGLLKIPTNQASAVSVPPAGNDHSFWAEFIKSPGQFSAGNHHGNQWWDYLTWNSARCDTAEFNAFPFIPRGKGGTTVSTGLTAGAYASMFHESDPKYNVLGIDKFKCFLIDTLQAFQVTLALDNVSCNGAVPAWVTTFQGATPDDGYDGSAVTKEFTKIIPDGLLTPGSHVQYFFRKSQVFGYGGFLMVPDTTTIRPQNGEGSLDAHRWQQFSVLPDNWKRSPWGGGLACILYVDFNDRRGDETVWTSTMDSIGGTAADRRGAYDGWSAPGGTDLDVATNPGVSSVFIANKNAQPGTVWDMYQMKGSESGSSCGGRPGNRLPYADITTAGKLSGKLATSGPTPQMLAQYRVVALMTGDLATTILGPATNIGEQDTLLFEQFIANATNRPRALFFQGQDFVSEERGRNAPFLANRLGVVWRDNSYQKLSANGSSCADLLTYNPITTTNDIYGTLNSCASTADVLNLNPSLNEAIVVSEYQNVGVNGGYTASVLKQNQPGGREWIALTNGWDIRRQWSRYCNSDIGRLQYYYHTVSNVFGSLCATWGTPGIPLDVPSAGHGGQFTNFMRVGNSVMRSGNATIRFGVASSDRVRVRLYDVTGRLVRTLADRNFQAGNDYSLTWDGADDGGNQVARGIYFARIDYAAKGASINGRVVVLR